MSAQSELEACPSHKGMSKPPKTISETPIERKLFDGERLNAERAETVDIEKAKSVPNVGDEVASSKSSKKRRNVRRNKDWSHIRARNRKIWTERDLEKFQESERR